MTGCKCEVIRYEIKRDEVRNLSLVEKLEKYFSFTPFHKRVLPFSYAIFDESKGTVPLQKSSIFL